MSVPYDTYHGWISAHRNKGDNAFRGAENFSSDEQKEIARLKSELRDTQDILEDPKKSYRYSGKVNGAAYQAVSELTDAAEHRGSVSGIPEKSGVSYSGYKPWEKRESSGFWASQESRKGGRHGF